MKGTAMASADSRNTLTMKLSMRTRRSISPVSAEPAMHAVMKHEKTKPWGICAWGGDKGGHRGEDIRGDHGQIDGVRMTDSLRYTPLTCYPTPDLLLLLTLCPFPNPRGAHTFSPLGLSAGVHRNTKVYIAASKNACMAPRSVTLRSARGGGGWCGA